MVEPISLFIFLVGLALGSFANAVIFRLDNLSSLLTVRSHCPYCRHRLSWSDLIPLFSYLSLGGRCRYCRGEISLQYPLVEAALGASALVLWAKFGFTLAFLIYLSLLTSLVILFVYDLKHMILPDTIVIPGFILALLGFLATYGVGLSSLTSLALGILVGGGALGLLYLAGQGNWLGLGDVKLGALLGALLGWPSVSVGLLTAFLLGSVVSLFLLAFRIRKMHSPIPFGPFLVGGGLIALLWGEELLAWLKQAFL
jgi:leader peptidase (prepilin peptidase)/N-methyltransferase